MHQFLQILGTPNMPMNNNFGSYTTKVATLSYIGASEGNPTFQFI